MIAQDNLADYRQLHEGIVAWLKQKQVTVVAPETLPSELYADASHPLTDGYKLLAHQLLAEQTFQAWFRK
jgi:hypothetical protein